jgi:hypothetical protein
MISADNLGEYLSRRIPEFAGEVREVERVWGPDSPHTYGLVGALYDFTEETLKGAQSGQSEELLGRIFATVEDVILNGDPSSSDAMVIDFAQASFIYTDIGKQFSARLGPESKRWLDKFEADRTLPDISIEDFRDVLKRSVSQLMPAARDRIEAVMVSPFPVRVESSLTQAISVFWAIGRIGDYILIYDDPEERFGFGELDFDWVIRSRYDYSEEKSLRDVVKDLEFGEARIKAALDHFRAKSTQDRSRGS